MSLVKTVKVAPQPLEKHNPSAFIIASTVCTRKRILHQGGAVRLLEGIIQKKKHEQKSHVYKEIPLEHRISFSMIN